jgi:hypothetical protein
MRAHLKHGARYRGAKPATATGDENGAVTEREGLWERDVRERHWVSSVGRTRLEEEARHVQSLLDGSLSVYSRSLVSSDTGMPLSILHLW